MLPWWCDTPNFSTIDTLGLYHNIVKSAHDFTTISEIATSDCQFCTTFGWSNLWGNINWNSWQPLVHVFVIRSILHVQRNFNFLFILTLFFWCWALSQSRTFDNGFGFSHWHRPNTVCTVWDINITVFRIERLETLTGNVNHIASSLRSCTWIDHGNLRFIVKPEIVGRFMRILAIVTLLLPVQWNCHGHW